MYTRRKTNKQKKRALGRQLQETHKWDWTTREPLLASLSKNFRPVSFQNPPKTRKAVAIWGERSEIMFGGGEVHWTSNCGPAPSLHATSAAHVLHLSWLAPSVQC